MVDLEKTVTSERCWCVPARPDSRTASALTPMGSMGFDAMMWSMRGLCVAGAPRTPGPPATRACSARRNRSPRGKPRWRAARTSRTCRPPWTCHLKKGKAFNIGKAFNEMRRNVNCVSEDHSPKMSKQEAYEKRRMELQRSVPGKQMEARVHGSAGGGSARKLRTLP